MRATRIVLLIANGVWLPFFAYWGASHVYYVATYPTTHDLIFASVLLANIIPTVVASFTLVGNIAYIWRSRPHAAFRIVLLIANGVWLLLYAVGGPLQVYVLATHEYAVAEAIATHILCFSILAGNITYIWPSRPHAHNEKGANASHTRQPLMGMRKPWGRVDRGAGANWGTYAEGAGSSSSLLTALPLRGAPGCGAARLIGQDPRPGLLQPGRRVPRQG